MGGRVGLRLVGVIPPTDENFLLIMRGNSFKGGGFLVGVKLTLVLEVLLLLHRATAAASVGVNCVHLGKWEDFIFLKKFHLISGQFQWKKLVITKVVKLSVESL